MDSCHLNANNILIGKITHQLGTYCKDFYTQFDLIMLTVALSDPTLKKANSGSR